MNSNDTWIAGADDRNELQKLPLLLRWALKWYRPEFMAYLWGRLDAAKNRNVIEAYQARELKEIFSRTVFVIAFLFACGSAPAADYMTELSNRVASIMAQPGFVKPGPVQTFSPLVDSITPAASGTHEPVIEAPSRAAELWLASRYASNRWNGVKWYLETPRGWLLPVDQLRGIAPGMTLNLVGLIPKQGYPAHLLNLPLPEGMPEYAPYDMKPVVIMAVRGWFSEDAKENPVTNEAFRRYSSPQSAIVNRLGRWIYSCPTIPPAAQLAALGFQ